MTTIPDRDQYKIRKATDIVRSLTEEGIMVFIMDLGGVHALRVKDAVEALSERIETQREKR